MVSDQIKPTGVITTKGKHSVKLAFLSGFLRSFA